MHSIRPTAAWPLPPSVGLGGAFAGVAGIDPGPLPLGDDVAAMRRALRNALEAGGRAIPNPAAGCVVVLADGRLADGATEAYGGLHAERAALAGLAPGEARGATLYVTLEPCSHTGRQPPCTEAIITAGIARCVVAVRDPYPLVDGRGIAALRAAGIAVEVGVCGTEAAAWHAPFLLEHLTGRMVVAAKLAQTLDGAMVYADGGSKWITGVEARAHAHWLRHIYDAVAVGAGTVLADRPALSVRDIARPVTRQPVRVVFDPRGRLSEPDLSMPLFDGAAPVVVVSGGIAAASLIAPHVLLAPSGGITVEAMLVVLGGPDVIAFLGRRLQSVMVEGGPQLLGQLAAADRIDLLHVFVAPKLAGPGGRRPDWAEARDGMTLLSANPLGADVLLEFAQAELADRLLSLALPL